MRNDPAGPEPGAGQGLRAIPTWTDRYARNSRSLVVLVAIGLLCAILAAVIGFALYAVRSERVALTWVSIALNVLIGAAGVYLACSGRMARWADRVGGGVTPALPHATQMRARRFDWMLALPVAGILVTARLLGLPAHYWQPMTAIYVVPALVYVVGRDGWTEWPDLLWPALYLLHAILVVAGIRLYVGVWYMDVFVPLGVYAMVGAAAAAAYSRRALRRLRGLAAGPDVPDEGEAGAS